VRLTTRSHDRDVAGKTYVYPVVSRRARGVSIGINLNPNNACNWRCVYCQVPGLTHGKGPEIDLERLEVELDEMLGAIFEGDYLEKHVPAGSRRVNDVAFSGNGEPTSSPHFAEAIERTLAVLARREATRNLKIVLITNGSLTHLEAVQRGLALLGAATGEGWFKLDSATDAGQARMNDVKTGADRSARNLTACAERMPTWIQTMMLERDGTPPSEEELTTYVRFLKERVEEGLRLEGVLLYGLARTSYQPEAPTLASLPAAWMEGFAQRVRKETGLTVRLSL